MSAPGIVCNVRSLAHEISGVQRYTRELLARFGDDVAQVAPASPALGMKGHAWEQFVLPGKLNGQLLWSPGNTGPITVERQVVTIADISPIDHPEWMSRKFATWYRFMIPRLLDRARMVLTVSHYSKQRMASIMPRAEAKIHVVHLAADDRFHPADDDAIAGMRARLALPEGRYILALGSVEPRKNLLRLLQAWAAVIGQLPADVGLVLAGAQGNATIFAGQSLDDLPPRVHFTGHVPDEMLPGLYAGAMASAYISLYEGFGLPPLESMACGTPVLVSNVASLPEVVGEAALLVDPLDVDGIGRRIVELVMEPDLRAALKAQGLARAKQFSWDRTATETLRLLEEAAQA
jgi:glycosyltransferase involved in cell wall biosynthesis